MMNNINFKKTKSIYIPVYAFCVAAILLAIIFLLPVFAVISEKGHSVNDNLHHTFVYDICTAFLWRIA